MAKLVPNAHWLLRGLLGAVLSLTAAAKGFYLALGHYSASTIFGAIASDALPVAWLIVVLELGLGLAAFSRMSGPRLWIVVLAMLSLSTGLLVREAHQPQPRSCGCVTPDSELQDAAVARSGLVASIGFNVLLMTGTIPLVALPSRRNEPSEL